MFGRPILIEKCEGKVQAILAEGLCAHAPHFVFGARSRRARRQVAQQMPASIFEHPLRRLENCGEYAAHVAAIIRKRADRRGEVALFEIVAAINQRWQVDQESGFPLPYDSVVNRFYEVQRFGIHFAKGAAQRRRVLRSHERHVAIVVQVREVRSPTDGHRTAAVQHDAYARSQGLRPLFHGAERRSRPVERAHTRGHLAVTGKH